MLEMHSDDAAQEKAAASLAAAFSGAKEVEEAPKVAEATPARQARNVFKQSPNLEQAEGLTEDAEPWKLFQRSTDDDGFDTCKFGQRLSARDLRARH